MSFITLDYKFNLNHQDIHTTNIVFNRNNSRPVEVSESGNSDTPIVPFHSTFDFRMAFIDFECAIHFEEGVEPLVRPEMVPASHIAAPEQGGEDKYDMFAADVFNLGRTLQIEFQNARSVGIYYSQLWSRSAKLQFVGQPPNRSYRV